MLSSEVGCAVSLATAAMTKLKLDNQRRPRDEGKALLCAVRGRARSQAGTQHIRQL